MLDPTTISPPTGPAGSTPSLNAKAGGFAALLGQLLSGTAPVEAVEAGSAIMPGPSLTARNGTVVATDEASAGPDPASPLVSTMSPGHAPKAPPRTAGQAPSGLEIASSGAAPKGAPVEVPADPSGPPPSASPLIDLPLQAEGAAMSVAAPMPGMAEVLPDPASSGARPLETPPLATARAAAPALGPVLQNSRLEPAAGQPAETIPQGQEVVAPRGERGLSNDLRGLPGLSSGSEPADREQLQPVAVGRVPVGAHVSGEPAAPAARPSPMPAQMQVAAAPQVAAVPDPMQSTGNEPVGFDPLADLRVDVLEARASEKSSGSFAPPPAPTRSAPNPAASQVEVFLARAAHGRIDRMVVQLEPMDLGKVEIRLEFGEEGRVGAVISAERPETLEALQRDAHALERSLRDAGLRPDGGGLSFDLKRGTSDGGEGRQQPAAGDGGRPSTDEASGDHDDGRAERLHARRLLDIHA